MNAAKVSGGTSSNWYRLPLATNHTERVLLSGSYSDLRIEVDGMTAVNDLGDDVFQVHSRFMRRHSRELGNRRYDEPISQNKQRQH
ncbi:hypothetical protein [Mesorhizobium sp. BHbdii]